MALLLGLTSQRTSSHNIGPTWPAHRSNLCGVPPLVVVPAVRATRRWVRKWWQCLSRAESSSKLSPFRAYPVSGVATFACASNSSQSLEIASAASEISRRDPLLRILRIDLLGDPADSPGRLKRPGIALSRRNSLTSNHSSRTTTSSANEYYVILRWVREIAAAFAAEMARSMSESEWAAEMKMASNWDGGSKMPCLSISWKNAENDAVLEVRASE